MSLASTDSETEIQEKSVEFFVSFVQVFGLPKSIGQIYGLLFIAEEPLSMDDIADSLRISKGSASQGLGLLRTLGAVTTASTPAPNDRREHFVADLNVSRIVTHFFEDRFRPCLDRGEQLLDSMVELAGDNALKPDSSRLQRVRALQKWQTRGRTILPLMLRWLNR